ncbi:MAG: hypothetical protein ABUT39_27645 [Acidobacteriota bacterium]
MTGAAGGYLRFLAWAVGVTVAAALLGWLPTRRLGGEEAIPAMLAGCAVSLLASALGGVPIALAHGAAPQAQQAKLQSLLMAMAVRFAAVVVLTLAAVLSGLFHTAPLLLWVAIGYGAQLVVETRYALAKDVETR